MGVFEVKKNQLLKEIAKAKKEKQDFLVKAKARDIKVNKMIAQGEELDQLKFDLNRLKVKPKNKAELLLRKQRISKVKKSVGKLGNVLGKTGKTVLTGLFLLGGGKLSMPKVVVVKSGKKFVVKKIIDGKSVASKSFGKMVDANKFAVIQRRKL